MGFLNAFTQPEALHRLAARKATVYALEFVPRITRAQSMDALSSMATVSGYNPCCWPPHACRRCFRCS